MKKKIQVSVGSVAQSLDRFEYAWRQAEKGGARAAQVRLTFDSLSTLLKNLTPARWTLLEQLKRDGVRFFSSVGRLSKVSRTCAVRTPLISACRHACSKRSSACATLPTDT